MPKADIGFWDLMTRSFLNLYVDVMAAISHIYERRVHLYMQEPKQPNARDTTAQKNT